MIKEILQMIGLIMMLFWTLLCTSSWIKKSFMKTIKDILK